MKGIVIKGSDSSGIKTWVTPPAETPRPATVIAEDMGKEFRIESGGGRGGRRVVALRLIAMMGVVDHPLTCFF